MQQNKPTPQTFPTQGPRSMQFVAYDPNRFDACGDPDCRCRSSKRNICGYGATEQEALSDFWQQMEEA